MLPSPNFTSSLWFVLIVSLLVSLGTQVLIGALTPLTALDWLDGESRQGPVVLIAGVTSFWRGDAFIRALSFGTGALVACLLASKQSWLLVMSLVAMSTLCSVFAQFPRPASLTQLALWGSAGPLASLAVSALFCVWKGDA